MHSRKQHKNSKRISILCKSPESIIKGRVCVDITHNRHYTVNRQKELNLHRWMQYRTDRSSVNEL